MFTTDNYSKNMLALTKRHPDFAQLIKENEAKEIDWLLEHKENNIKIKDSKNNVIWVYKEDNPASNENITENIMAHNEKGTLLFGLGLGHALHQLLEMREPDHVIIIIEPILKLWQLAFCTYDFSEAIAGSTLFPCVGAAEVEYSISWLEGHKAIEGWNKIIDRVAYRRAEYWQLMDYTNNVLNQSIGNINTVASHGEEIALNDINTLPWIIQHRGVIELQGLYADKPAIVVVTGPSLSKNIHLLLKVQQEKTAVIIAVAQALRPLLAYGIKPDFICTVDFGEVNMSHLDGLMDQDIPLVTISKAYAPLVKAYKGPKFICASPLEGAGPDELPSLLNHRGVLMQGGSVLHMAVGLAACLGNNPISLIGADLSYPSISESHCEQADSRGGIEIVETSAGPQLIWKIKDPRSVIHNKISSMGSPVYVDGYFDEEVITNSGLQSFITTLESYVKQSNAAGVMIVDSTEGGAYKKGTRRMFLQDFIDKYCTEKIDKSILDPLLTLAEDGPVLIQKAMSLLKKDIKKLQSIITQAGLGIRYANKAKKHWEKDILLDCFIANAKHTKEAHNIANTIAPMGYVLIKTLRLMESREWALPKEKEADALTDCKVREKSIKRSLLILNEASNAAEKIKKACEDTLQCLEQYMTKDNSILQPTGELKPPNIKDADEFFSAGNFARPLLEAIRILKTDCDGEALTAYQTACEMREEAIKKAERLQEVAYKEGRNKIPVYLDLIEDGKELGRSNRYKEAIPKLQEAIELVPDREEAHWGLATVLSKLNLYNEALIEYEWLKNKDKNNLRYVFEAGQVMLKTPERRDEGIACIQQAINDDPTNYKQFQEDLDDLSRDT